MCPGLRTNGAAERASLCSLFAIGLAIAGCGTADRASDETIGSHAAALQSGVLPPNDDGSSELIPLDFTFRFFGVDYTDVYINNNGNVSFNAPLWWYTPYAFPSTSDAPMIAPFFADVDTRNGRGQVSYTGNENYMRVTWDNVGYYSAYSTTNPDLRDTFTLTLQRNNGILFEFGAMAWTTGDASGGNAGFGGDPATLGLDNGDGTNAVVFRRYGDTSVQQLDGTTWYFQTDKASLPVPSWKQCEAPWGDDLTLNSASRTLCETGCFVTSTAMLLNSLGHNVNPELLNVFLREFMAGGEIAFGSIPTNRVFLGQTDDVPGPKLRFRDQQFSVTPTTGPLPPEGDTSLRQQIVDQVGAAIDTYGPVILRVPSRNWGVSGYLATHTHAVLAYGTSGNDILIREPGWSTSPGTLSAYVSYVNNHVANVKDPPAHHPDWQLTNADGQLGGGDFSWLAPSVYTYTEVLTPFHKQIIQGQANSPVELVITDPLGRRLGFDPVSGQHFAEIPSSVYYRRLETAPAGDFPLEVDEEHEPIVFEIGEFIEGNYTFTVHGIDQGPWSIGFGVSDPVFGYSPQQYRASGVAGNGSTQQFVRHVTGDFSVQPDTTPPLVTCSSATEFLWPPNHKMVPVALEIAANDDRTPPESLFLVAVTLSSTEPDDGEADGNTVGDCNGGDGYSGEVDVGAAFATSDPSIVDASLVWSGDLLLRAERQGTGTGRTYTLTAVVADEAGNTGSCSRAVVVEHDQGIDVNDPAGTYQLLGPSDTVRRVFEVNHGKKYRDSIQ